MSHTEHVMPIGRYLKDKDKESASSFASSVDERAARPTVGQETSSRLSSRGETPELERRTFSGGAEVFQGGLATQALKAMGARAMTLDHSIIVNEDFDPSKPEHQALYAHERVHDLGSGGRGGDSVRDAEEISARSMERMVLHRATTSGTSGALADPSQVMRDAVDNQDSNDTSGKSESKDPTERGYQAMLAEGMEPREIVEKLVKDFVESQDEERSLLAARFGGNDF